MSDQKFLSPEEQRKNREKNRASANASLRRGLTSTPLAPPPVLTVKAKPTGEPAEVISLAEKRKERACSTT